jgi:hypothetical protein
MAVFDVVQFAGLLVVAPHAEGSLDSGGIKLRHRFSSE